VTITTPRLTPLRDEEMAEDVRTFLQPWTVKGRLYNIMRLLAIHPALLRAWEPFGKHAFNASTLTDRQRELLILRITWRCRSHYEFGHHMVLAGRYGLTQDDFDAVIAGPGDARFDALESALLTAADELHDDAVISDTTWRRLARELNPQQLLDVVYTVGAYRLGATAMNSFGTLLEDGIPLHPAFVDGSGHAR
jgi:alkylhydroperoxidase family enzyme